MAQTDMGFALMNGVHTEPRFARSSIQNGSQRINLTLTQPCNLISHEKEAKAHQLNHHRTTPSKKNAGQKRPALKYVYKKMIPFCEGHTSQPILLRQKGLHLNNRSGPVLSIKSGGHLSALSHSAFTETASFPV
jgi:hypothetical protein